MVVGYHLRHKHVGSYPESALHVEIPVQLWHLSGEEAEIWIRNVPPLAFFCQVFTVQVAVLHSTDAC